MIKELINDYLVNERTIILAVHPANVDFHNSQIMEDARCVDPKTERTIPVITKPDLIDIGAESSTVDLLLGRKTATFEKGFHIVKCRGQIDITNGKTLAEALSDEAKFLNKKQPWANIKDRTLFGVSELVVKLSALFVELVQRAIPEEIATKKLAVQQD